MSNYSNGMKKDNLPNDSINDLSQITQSFMEKAKSTIIKYEQIQIDARRELLEIQQQNEFLKDIRIVLDSKVKTLEKAYSKFPIISKKQSQKLSNDNTERMFFDIQMPLLALKTAIKISNDKITDQISIEWFENYKKLENSVLIAKSQVEEIIDFNEKGKLV